MACTDILTRKVNVYLGHLHLGVSQKVLKGKHVAPVADEPQAENVPQMVWSYGCLNHLRVVPEAVLKAPGEHFVTVVCTEYRDSVLPVLRADSN